MEILTRLPVEPHYLTREGRKYAAISTSNKQNCTRGKVVSWGQDALAPKQSCGFMAVYFIVLHNVHVYKYSFKHAQCYFFKKYFSMRIFLKPQLWGGGEAADLLSQAHTFPTGEEMKTHDEVMEVTLSRLTTRWGQNYGPNSFPFQVWSFSHKSNLPLKSEFHTFVLV